MTVADPYYLYMSFLKFKIMDKKIRRSKIGWHLFNSYTYKTLIKGANFFDENLIDLEDKPGVPTVEKVLEDEVSRLHLSLEMLSNDKEIDEVKIEIKALETFRERLEDIKQEYVTIYNNSNLSKNNDITKYVIGDEQESDGGEVKLNLNSIRTFEK